MTRELSGALEGWLDAHFDELVALRRHLHAQPELAFEEHRTTEYLIERLSVTGLEPRVLSCGTGLVCDVGEQPPRVALRADIDALAMDDEVDAPYCSQVPGVAHACGHDVHTTVVLGAGLFLHKWLIAQTGRGGVRLIFQPAEEKVPGGALAVLGDGALDEISAIYGLHCDPKLPVGQVGVRAGAITSAADMFEIVLTGPGGHTARPERTVDLVSVISRVAVDLPAVVRNGTPPEHPLEVVFGAVQAGKASNVIPTHALLRGTARTTDRAVWDRAQTALREALAQVIADSGAESEVRYTVGIPPVVNDAGATAVLAEAAAELLGSAAVVPTAQSAGGDDFAWYLDRVAGSYARLGVHDPVNGDAMLDLHAGHFDVDERAIAVGIRVLAGAALRSIGKN
ncbi:MAG: amidohydrolase [Actinobacteria bacterium]|nr:amidohydrolase [Actinomycetota bacterium]